MKAKAKAVSTKEIKKGAEFTNHDPAVKFAIESVSGRGSEAEVLYMNIGKDCGKYDIQPMREFKKMITGRITPKKGRKAA